MPRDCPKAKFTFMSLRVSTNQSLRLHNSYANLFKVAQYNLTLWLIEENVARIEKRQKLLPKPLSYHTPIHAPKGANSRQ